MSKELEEIKIKKIRNLENAIEHLISNLEVGAELDAAREIKASIKEIRAVVKDLAKPVQYVVEIVTDSYGSYGRPIYFARINGEEIGDIESIIYNKGVIKENALSYLCKCATSLGQPPITIEQITFVEV